MIKGEDVLARWLLCENRVQNHAAGCDDCGITMSRKLHQRICAVCRLARPHLSDPSSIALQCVQGWNQAYRQRNRDAVRNGQLCGTLVNGFGFWLLPRHMQSDAWCVTGVWNFLPAPHSSQQLVSKPSFLRWCDNTLAKLISSPPRRDKTMATSCDAY